MYHTWLPPHQKTQEQPIEDDREYLVRTIQLGAIVFSCVVFIFGVIWLSVTGGW